MADCLAMLLATQVARVRFPVPARPTFYVEKVSLLCYPASGGTFSSSQLGLYNGLKKFAVTKVCGDLRLDWLCIAMPQSVQSQSSSQSKGVLYLEA
jgi:hypothetical protein